MMMTDRIKLAEAMNQYPTDKTGRAFNPFTDANDDYAVLEWIREQHYKTYAIHYMDKATTEIYGAHPIDYQIGDFARAALKVIE